MKAQADLTAAGEFIIEGAGDAEAVLCLHWPPGRKFEVVRSGAAAADVFAGN